MTASDKGRLAASDFDLAFALSDRGNAQNEDFACVGRVEGTVSGHPDGLFGVLADGATGLFRTRLFPDGWQSDAQWLAHTAGCLIAHGLRAGGDAEDVLAAAVAELGRQVEDAAGVPLDAVDPDTVPSCTLAVALVRHGTCSVWALGDSPVVVTRRAGAPIVLADARLQELDAGLLRLMVERTAAAQADGARLTVAEKRALITEEQRANRRQRNVAGGYGIFDPTGAGLDHLMHAELPTDEVAFVSAYSDGMFAADERYGILPLGCRCEPLTADDALAAIDRMRVIEAADPDLERYSRFKVGDDASLFQLRVSV